jgi:ABC-type dipeptide/oligopeptide/nickel transport system permease subunit
VGVIAHFFLSHRHLLLDVAGVSAQPSGAVTKTTKAAKSLGVRRFRILVTEVMPNVIKPTLAFALKSGPHAIFVPAAFIFLTVLALNLVGDIVRDRLELRQNAI